MTDANLENLGTCKFNVHDTKAIKFFWKKAKSYRHFRNQYLIIRNFLYLNQREGELKKDSPYEISKNIDSKSLYQSFCNPTAMRAVLKNRSGGKLSDKVSTLQSVLSNWELFQSMKQTCEDLQAKSLYKELKKINAEFKGFYTKLKEGDSEARPPKPKKLERTYRVTVPVDQDCISFKRKNVVRININGGMVNVPIKHQSVLKLIGSFSNVQSAELVCSESELVLILPYHKTEFDNPTPPQNKKYAGLDLGIKNIASYFIDDLESKSVIIDGQKLIVYNCNNNRKLAKAKSEKDLLKNKLEESSDESTLADYFLQRCNVSQLYSKRRKYFSDQFHKLSRRILEDLRSKGVSTVFVSRNLGACKNSSEGSMGKKNNQKFYQIPIIKLIDYIELKASEYGIEIIEIDEAYTSKCSSLSGDIVEAQKWRKEGRKDQIKTSVSKSIRNNVLNGRRLRRSIFQDGQTKLKFHADLNAAVNHIRVGLKLKKDSHRHLKDYIWKLANPIKVRFKPKALNCFPDLAIQ